jgi:hypothetical protein
LSGNSPVKRETRNSKIELGIRGGLTSKDEERCIAQEPRDAEEYLATQADRFTGVKREEKVGLLRSE